MNGKDIKSIRQRYGISQAKFASMLGVASRTVQNWEEGKVIPQSKHELLRLFLDGKIQLDPTESNIAPADVAPTEAERISELKAALSDKNEMLKDKMEIIQLLKDSIKELKSKVKKMEGDPSLHVSR